MNGKLVFSFILGAVAGGIGTYFAMKNATEAYIEREIEDFKADYKENHKCECKGDCKNSENQQKTDENLRENAEKALKSYSTATEKPVSSIDKYKKETNDGFEKVNYAKIRTPDIDEIDETDIEGAIDTAVGPVTISPSEYMDNTDGLERVVWNYLPLEGKVYSENGEEEIRDGIELIGELNLDSFGEFEVDTLYVKNAREGIKIDCILYEDMTYEQFMQEI